MQREHWFTLGALVFALSGLLHPVLSRFCAYESNRRVGATVSTTFDSTSPLFGAALAMTFLGEQLDWVIALGTLVTIFGVTFLYWNPVNPGQLIRTAVLFSIGAAATRALAAVAAKFGLDLVPNPIMAVFCAFAVSTLVSLTLMRVQNKPVFRELKSRGAWWFVISGSFSAAAGACLYFSLSMGKVLIVLPIVSAAPLFTLLIALVLRLEVVTSRIALGVLITIVGVATVSIAPVLGV